MKQFENKLAYFFRNQGSLAAVLIRGLIGFHLLHAVHSALFNKTVMAGVVGFFRSQNIILPEFTAPLTAWSEAICACLFILGFLTRTAAVVMIIVFINAIIIVHLGNPYPEAFPALVMLIGSVYLLINGPAKYSVDTLIFKV